MARRTAFRVSLEQRDDNTRLWWSGDYLIIAANAESAMKKAYKQANKDAVTADITTTGITLLSLERRSYTVIL